ncbi:unnamed protein product, partial [marine sediment metagenome]
ALKPHPENYKNHPDIQLEHICENLKQFGLYRNLIISSDGFILVGHGMIAALRRMNVSHVPVIRLEIPHDSAQALKLLVADNEISHLAEIDDRQLSELLKVVKDKDALAGTGYDKMKLANLL